MPELPEVEVLKRSLEEILIGRKIIEVNKRFHTLRFPLSDDLDLVNSSKILKMSRRAKYLVIELSNSRSLVVHLGMSGRFTIKPSSYEAQKHDHVIFHLDRDGILVFNDPRRLGMIYLLDNNLVEAKLFANLGPEPLSEIFDSQYLASKIKGRKMPIKNLLMDNKIVVGIGNIYASESLFLAKIDPRRSSSSLTQDEIDNLTNPIKLILEKAISAGGTTLKDFLSGGSKPGFFKQQLSVYGLHNQECSNCDNLIFRIKQAGRASFHCSNCQK